MKRFIYFAILILLLFLIPTLFVEKTRNFAISTVSPISRWLVGRNTALLNFSHNLRQIPQLRSSNQQLEAEVISLEQQLADQENVIRENQLLRQQLGLTGVVHDTTKILAHVILQGSDPLDYSLTIDAGSNQGVRIGQPAVFQGFLVGQVILVRDDTAIIRSTISTQSHLQAWLSDSHEKGLLIGDGNSIYLSDITQGVNVKNGALVETSGLGGSLPQGIPIGQVSQAESKQSDLSQKFLISSSTDPHGIDTLFILLTPSQ